MEAFFREEEQETDLSQARAQLFKTFSKWIAEEVVRDKNLHVPSLAPIYMPQKLGQLLGGANVCWFFFFRNS